MVSYNRAAQGQAETGTGGVVVDVFDHETVKDAFKHLRRNPGSMVDDPQDPLGSRCFDPPAR